eukprot:806735_1
MGMSASASLEHLDERFPLYRKGHQKTFNELCELVVFGFIRNLERNEFLLCMLIPTSITNIILHFFPPIPAFKWNKTIKGNNMIIVDETTIEVASSSDWTSSFADFYISPEMIDWYEWTVELQNWDRTNISDINQPALMTGFVLHPIHTSVNNYNTYLGSGENQDS